MSRLLLYLVSFVLLASAAAAEPGGERTAFAKIQRELSERLARSSFETPLVIEARVDAKEVEGQVYSILDHSVEALTAALSDPVALCDILTLHLNVKSCYPDEALGSGSTWLPLRVETARKHYVPPRRRSRAIYRLEVCERDPGFACVLLRTNRGPLGVRDVRIEIRGIRVDDDTSFVELRYRYAPGLLARATTRAFLATLGRKKIGFSVTGVTPDGRPIYVRGPQAAVERNALRHHLALVAYLETRDAPASSRFEQRIARWFDLTEGHSRQLWEMRRDEYLGIKRRERLDDEDRAAASAIGRRR
ncbi:MAG: hypothetical protein VX466_15575 [Myxococcota bacterium]|nr:hypothetical protein [Myxococcota bacterium]